MLFYPYTSNIMFHLSFSSHVTTLMYTSVDEYVFFFCSTLKKTISMFIIHFIKDRNLPNSPR